MAMIDYGAIAFKNGKLISTAMFTPMKDMVGWEDNDATEYYEGFSTDEACNLCLSHNYFAFIGDKDCTIAFYKERIVVIERYPGYDIELPRLMYYTENFANTKYTWTKWTHHVWCFLPLDEGNDIDYNVTKVVVTRRNGYYVLKWDYKGDKYKVYFGHGVDFDYYKKSGCVNYYRSPKFLAFKYSRLLLYKIRNLLETRKDKIWDE